MKNANRKCVAISAMCFISLISFCGERVGDDIAAISEKINQCLSALSDSNYGNSRYIMEFGLPDRMVEREKELGLIVSNHIDLVYSNFPKIATTKIRKLILLASSWYLSDGYYVNCLSRNVDLAISGDISCEELRWFMRGHRIRRLIYILDNQYDKPGISNIVNKLMSYTGETNKYMKVLSGAAKNEYLEFEKFMIEGPESP